MTRREPGPGEMGDCVHIGRIEEMLPASPGENRCRNCYGRVWGDPQAVGPRQVAAALSAVSTEFDLYDDRQLDGAAEALLARLRGDR